MKEHNAARPYRLKPFEYSSQYWILKCLADARQPLNILDVGTADGYLCAILKERAHYLVGVENDQFLADKAKAYNDVLHHADIESFDFPYREHFDVIVLPTFGNI